MTTRISTWVQLFLLIFVFVSCSKADSGKSKGKSQPPTPDRIVTLTPSATSLVVELGAADKIVGRDKYSIEPEKLLALPIVGDFINPNIEAIAALAPQLVLLDESQQSAKNSLETLGIPTFSLRMHTLSDVRNGLIEVGHSLNRDEIAKQSLATIDEKIAAVRKLAAARSGKPKVLVLIDRDPDSLRAMIAADPNTYVDELLTIVGATNILSNSPVQYPQISAELIMQAQPQIITDLSRAENKDAYSAIAEVPAVANDLIHLGNNPKLLTPSPQVGEALEILMKLTELPSQAP